MDNKIATYFGLGYSEEGGSSSSSLSHLMNIMPPPPSNHFNLFNLNNQQYSKNDHQDFETHSSSSNNNLIKAKIMSHPHYPKLLSAYINCQKVGAPPEVVARLEEACSSSLMIARAANSSSSSTLNSDPALDQFMEAYCEMLIKYEQELSKPVKEAMIFLSTIEAQFKSLALSTSLNQVVSTGETERRMNGTTSEDDMECEYPIDPLAEDRELKGQLLRRYSGYLGNLKQEFMKKKKKGKLPKEARQQLLDWWTQHYKWPYPSESQKVALAESTGLDQKQINNWFINQRKRHWKPTDELQTYVVMGDASHPHYFLENNIGFANPYPFDIAPTTLI